MKRIFYIMGKSSSGKDSIYKILLSELDLKPIVLYTTRPMRENEQEGREYHFVSRENFEKMKKIGEVIEERTYNTVHGEWIYFTAKDSIDLESGSSLGIGTLESYVRLRESFGDAVVPIYIEVEDGLRLSRALERERNEMFPKYAEMCRRFLADSEDFSEENIKSAGIERRFSNNGEVGACVKEISDYIKSKMESAEMRA